MRVIAILKFGPMSVREGTSWPLESWSVELAAYWCRSPSSPVSVSRTFAPNSVPSAPNSPLRVDSTNSTIAPPMSIDPPGFSTIGFSVAKTIGGAIAR